MPRIVHNGDENTFISSDGKIIQNIVPYCDECASPIDFDDLVKIAELNVDSPYDQIITFECYICAKASEGKPGKFFAIQKLLDEQFNAFKMGVAPRDWRDI